MFTSVFLILVWLCILLLGGVALSAAPIVQSPAKVVRVGTASWYGAECAGRIMANGKKFVPEKLTCASWHYPLGTTLIVTHGQKSVRVKVTDRGPAKRLHREIDLSAAAFKKLSSLDEGLIQVTVSEL
jgi:rare lipoprotein A